MRLKDQKTGPSLLIAMRERQEGKRLGKSLCKTSFYVKSRENA